MKKLEAVEHSQYWLGLSDYLGKVWPAAERVFGQFKQARLHVTGPEKNSHVASESIQQRVAESGQRFILDEGKTMLAYSWQIDGLGVVYFYPVEDASHNFGMIFEVRPDRLLVVEQLLPEQVSETKRGSQIRKKVEEKNRSELLHVQLENALQNQPALYASKMECPRTLDDLWAELQVWHQRFIFIQRTLAHVL